MKSPDVGCGGFSTDTGGIPVVGGRDGGVKTTGLDICAETKGSTGTSGAMGNDADCVVTGT